MKPRLICARFSSSYSWDWFVEYDGMFYTTGIRYSVRGMRMPYVMFIAKTIAQTQGLNHMAWTEDHIERRVAS